MIDVIEYTERPDYADAELVFLAMHPGIQAEMEAFSVVTDCDGRREN